AGEIILAGEQIERAYFSIDFGDPAAQIAIHPVKIKVALEHARPTLLVSPQRLAARGIGALWRNEPGDQRGADFAAMHVGTVEPGGVVPRRLEVGGLEPNQRAEFGGVVDREIEHDATADRAA